MYPNGPGNVRMVFDADRSYVTRLLIPDTAQKASSVTASGCRPDLITIIRTHPRDCASYRTGTDLRPYPHQADVGAVIRRHDVERRSTGVVERERGYNL